MLADMVCPNASRPVRVTAASVQYTVQRRGQKDKGVASPYTSVMSPNSRSLILEDGG